MKTSPEDAFISVTIMRIAVVFPAPLGPTKPTMLPSSTDIERFERARNLL